MPDPDGTPQNGTQHDDAPREEDDRRGGPVAYMARNTVAANLLMVALVAAGIAALGVIVQEVFPEFSLDAVSVTVPYPGATPEEVEESIVQKIEEQIEAVEGVKELRATAAEGLATVIAELKLGTNVSRAVDDIKAEVDQIATFPADAEEPRVTELTNRRSVIRIALYGDVPARSLKELAYRAEEELSQLPEVSYVEVSGIRDYEVSIEVPQRVLRAYNLSLPRIAQLVGQSSLDLSAGTIETSEEDIRLRTLGQNYTQQDFEDIVLLARPDGATVRLGQIAEIDDGFADTDLVARYNGQPAVFVEVFRTSDERVLEIATAVNTYLDKELRLSLPTGVEASIWENSARILRDRIGLLLKNAAIGLALVLLALTLFLNLRLAFWVAVGIGISFVGTLAVMVLLGVSINQISLFGFILAIGIVVDDAIVVGENVYLTRERGASGREAAIRGATRIAGPVIFAVLTTVVAFTPLLFVPGTIGKILGAIPVVVISVLMLSLVESLLVLPAHLSHLPPPDQEPGNPVTRFFERAQGWVDRQLKRFVNGPLERALRFATAYPPIVIATALVFLVLSVGLVQAGLIRIQFFPAIEGDVVTANLEMPQGTPVSLTEQIVQRLEAAGRAAIDSVDAERPDDAPPLLEAVYAVIGRQAREGGPDGGGGATVNRGNLATVQFKLLEAQQRELSSKRFEEEWREAMGPVPAAKALSFSSSLVDVGAPVNVQLSHPDAEALDAISERVQQQLEQIAGVYDIQSDQSAGTRELQFELKPTARALGFTLQDVATQVRGAFFGNQALRVQRGREDVRVYVRLPERERDALSDILDYRLQTPGGGSVPLRQVADVRYGTSPAALQRLDGRRVVTVTADVSTGTTSGQEVTGRLRSEILPALERDYPQLTYSFGGEQEQQAESFGALGRGFLLALFGIFALLAIPFRSYLQPLVIMAAIPFGIVGALFAHLVLGLSVGILSLFGIIGLSGVIVNDALVMIDFVNEKRMEGASMRDAIIAGAQQRFRPILLTSITTFLGVAPLVFEQSLQAQFLIPMAASLGFGILFGTVILMLLVPALAMLQYRGETWFQRHVLGRSEDETEVVHGSYRHDRQDYEREHAGT